MCSNQMERDVPSGCFTSHHSFYSRRQLLHLHPIDDEFGEGMKFESTNESRLCPVCCIIIIYVDRTSAVSPVHSSSFA